MSYPKNTTLNNIPLVMTDFTSHLPATGLAVSVLRRRDAETTFSAGTLSAVTETSRGTYIFNALAADMNGDFITFLATAPGADDRYITIRTT